jgi:hypothetical protein
MDYKFFDYEGDLFIINKNGKLSLKLWEKTKIKKIHRFEIKSKSDSIDFENDIEFIYPCIIRIVDDHYKIIKCDNDIRYKFVLMFTGKINYCDYFFNKIENAFNFEIIYEFERVKYYYNDFTNWKNNKTQITNLFNDLILSNSFPNIHTNGKTIGINNKINNFFAQKFQIIQRQHKGINYLILYCNNDNNETFILRSFHNINTIINCNGYVQMDDIFINQNGIYYKLKNDIIHIDNNNTKTTIIDGKVKKFFGILENDKLVISLKPKEGDEVVHVGYNKCVIIEENYTNSNFCIIGDEIYEYIKSVKTISICCHPREKFHLTGIKHSYLTFNEFDKTKLLNSIYISPVSNTLFIDQYYEVNNFVEILKMKMPSINIQNINCIMNTQNYIIIKIYENDQYKFMYSRNSDKFKLLNINHKKELLKLQCAQKFFDTLYTNILTGYDSDSDDDDEIFNNFTIRLHIDSDPLVQILNVMKNINCIKKLNLEAEIFDAKRGLITDAYGDGTNKEMWQKIIDIMYHKFFIKYDGHNYTYINTNAIKRKKLFKWYLLGQLLAQILILQKIKLSFKLPILLLKIIDNKIKNTNSMDIIDIDELKYFLKNDSYEIYKNVKKINNIDELNMGFKTINDIILYNLNLYDNNDCKTVEEIYNVIGNGFLSLISRTKKLSDVYILNPATLDTFFSVTSINVNTFINEYNYIGDKKHKLLIDKILKESNEDKIKNFIKALTGIKTYNVFKNITILVLSSSNTDDTSNLDYYISVCSRALTIYDSKKIKNVIKFILEINDNHIKD